MIVAISLLLTGCRWNDVQTKRSFVRWNLDNLRGSASVACPSPALELASRNSKQLACLMENSPAPTVEQLSGKWRGINKGLGAALVNLTQDIKEFQVDGSCVHGNNISVKQVPIDHLERCGFEAEVDKDTCQPKRNGNFIVCRDADPNQPLRLDYTIAENKWNDPSKVLVDKLVSIDDDLLLGRAYAKIGLVKIPVAYFVLYRPTCHR